MKRRKLIAVIGNKSVEAGGVREKLAFEIGKALIDHGYRVQTGGLSGVMEAVMRGCKSSKSYREGDTVALLPSFDSEKANKYADIVIPTGLDMMRNALVANADAVIGVGGGAGTLCEYAFAWSLKRLIIAFENSGGWSEKLAGTRVDDTIRYENIPEDRVYGVRTAEEAIALLDKYLDTYNIRHSGIK